MYVCTQALHTCIYTRIHLHKDEHNHINFVKITVHVLSVDVLFCTEFKKENCITKTVTPYTNNN